MQTRQRSFNTKKRIKARYADPTHDTTDVMNSMAGIHENDRTPEINNKILFSNIRSTGPPSAFWGKV